MFFLTFISIFMVFAILYYIGRTIEQKKEEILKCQKFIENGAYDKAINYCKSFIEKYPKEPVPYYYLGLSYYNIGDVDKALENFEKAEELENSLFNKINLSSIIMDEIAFYKDYAKVLRLAKRYDKALMYYKNLLRDIEREGKKNKIKEILQEIAEVYEEIGDIDNAIDYYEESLIHDADKSSLYGKIAELYRTKGDIEKYNRYSEKAWDVVVR